MNDLIQFLIQHPIQTSLLIGLVLAYVIFEIKTGAGFGVSPQIAVNLINHKNAAVIDIRSTEEFAKNRIVGSLNMSISQLEARNKKLAKLGKKPIVVVCGLGKISESAVKKLKSEGFSNVYLLAGGITNWQKEGLPLTNKGE